MILKIAVVVFCIALVFGGIMIYGRYQMSKIPKLSFQEILEYTTKDNADAVITVGIVKDGQISYKVYGEKGKEKVSGSPRGIGSKPESDFAQIH